MQGLILAIKRPMLKFARQLGLRLAPLPDDACCDASAVHLPGPDRFAARGPQAGGGGKGAIGAPPREGRQGGAQPTLGRRCLGGRMAIC